MKIGTFFFVSYPREISFLSFRDYLALNVYVALCYYKLDYYDISQEVLDVYLKKNPESATATNLQACNQYRLYNGKAAEVKLRNRTVKIFI